MILTIVQTRHQPPLSLALLPVINPPTSGPNALLRHSTFTEIMVEQEKLHRVDVIQITAAIS